MWKDHLRDESCRRTQIPAGASGNVLRASQADSPDPAEALDPLWFDDAGVWVPHFAEMEAGVFDPAVHVGAGFKWDFVDPFESSTLDGDA